MKRILILAAVAAVAACAEPAEPETEAVEEVAEAVAIAADGQPTAGTYLVTDAEGVAQTEVLAEDGTFTTTNAEGEVTDTGTWEQKDPNTYCYTSNAEGSEQICNTEEVGDDGVWRSTNPSGETAIVERVEA